MLVIILLICIESDFLAHLKCLRHFIKTEKVSAYIIFVNELNCDLWNIPKALPATNLIRIAASEYSPWQVNWGLTISVTVCDI